jgi:indole-3-glycerol phosphate synthase
MEDILQKIIRTKEQELEQFYAPKPSLREALLRSETGIIAEFKRRSPSKGWIKEEGRAEEIPLSYQENGATALSILTDEKYFGGRLKFIKTARPIVTCPILRKDFIVDEYQLFQAREIGADAVLLIAADLKKDECKTLAKTAHELGLETLLEIHSEHELDYVGDNIDMVGVNNRNLGTFHTDVQNSYRLASKLPSDFVLVSESGISNPDTVRDLRKAGFRGFLIGETFMKTPDPGESLKVFIAQVTQQ